MPTETIESLANLCGLKPNVLWFLIGLFISLTIGSAVRLVGIWGGGRRAESREKLASLKTWWMLAALVTVGILLGRAGGMVLVAAISLAALNEYLTLIPTRPVDQRLQVWLYLAATLNFVWIFLGWFGVFYAFVPLTVFLFLPARMLLGGETAGFLNAVATLQWGLMLTVFCLSHAACLWTLGETNPTGGGAGWFLYLLVLTELDDIAQALVGRQWGRRRLTPRISPNKTWEGLLGGLAATLLLAVALAPWLTPLARPTSWLPLPYLPALVAGLLVTVGGVFGDVTMSAIKRDRGVKESGRLLPGQGGILDRVDSLTFTAPLFYWYARATG